MFCGSEKLYEIQISVFMNKVLLEHSHTNSFPYCIWLLSQYSRNHMALKEKVYQPLF